MRTAQAVVGANFGDEGKGNLTSFYAHQFGPSALVIRSNGGAQAGHTVVTPLGERHVFSHFGSGSFDGCASFLSRFFVVNPLLFFKERDKLATLGVFPHVAIDPDALVTTPYDMMVNQMIEEARGKARHGSCGIGFGETYERTEKSPFRVTAADLDKADLADRLRDIRREWLPQRLRALALTPTEKWAARVAADGIIDDFVARAHEMAGLCEIDRMILHDADNIIFEGAQGLLLDEDHYWFPHVTRSHTGIRNMTTIANEIGIDTLLVTYATRAYLTRHGAGPMPNELPAGELPYPGIVDETNLPNLWQGALRFGYLDLDLMRESITNDLKHNNGIRVLPQVAITCVDQVGSDLIVVEDGRTKKLSVDQLETLGTLLSYGPTRETIRCGNAALVA